MNLLFARCLLVFVAATLASSDSVSQVGYPLSPDGPCGTLGTCQEVIDIWNDASWADLVDADFHTGSEQLAAVRWYTSEGQGSCPDGEVPCDALLHSGNGACDSLSTGTSYFCGVTDELSNVLLSHAMGSAQQRFEPLRNFTERLRRADLNGLQCWRYYVQGEGNYDSPDSLCVSNDSASDASLRILGAYGIACAKQRAGLWSSGSDYCADYERQGTAIWGNAIPGQGGHHGEIKRLPNGLFYLANGYINQMGAPTAGDSFRPDYYELQFLMDFAEYIGTSDEALGDTLVQGVLDMLDAYVVSMGTNHIHRGKTGHFDQLITAYECDQLCTPPYMDNIDTWRTVPALSGLLNVHPDRIPEDVESNVFSYWREHYGDEAYEAGAAKPFEIWSDLTEVVKYEENSYKTLGMWIPLAAAYNAGYTEEAVGYLISLYDDEVNQFNESAYFGGYFSQFAQRAIGAATGLIDPASYLPVVSHESGAIEGSGLEVTVLPTVLHGTHLHVHVRSQQVEAPVAIEVVDTMGRIVLKTGNVPVSVEGVELSLDLSSVSSGRYFVRVVGSRGVEASPFTVVR